MPQYAPLTKMDLRERIKEIEERIKAMDRREKLLGDLKKWMTHRKLTVLDVQHMIKAMKPKRAAKAVKSHKPLQPAQARRGVIRGDEMFMNKGKLVPAKGDPDFRRAIREARMDRKLKVDDVAKKVGVSGATIANWEQGRNVPKDEQRKTVLKALELPMHLGAEASAAAAAANGKAHG